jgi:hypothetical protein
MAGKPSLAVKGHSFFLCLFGALSAACSAGELPRDSGWVALSDQLQARLCVNAPEIADDQAWRTEIELKNVSKAPIVVGGNMPDVFSPILCFSDGTQLKPTRTTNQPGQRYFFELGREVNQSVAFSEEISGRPSEFNYIYCDRLWKVAARDYTIGGKLRLETRISAESPTVVLEAEMPPVVVRNWGSISDEELRRRVADIRKNDQYGSAYALWHDLIRLVRPGMLRCQAEIVLPQFWATGLFSGGGTTGSTQSENYPVDLEWQIAISYDFSRSAPDENGFDQPKNRVLTAPRLSRIRTRQPAKIAAGCTP